MKRLMALASAGLALAVAVAAAQALQAPEREPVAPIELLSTPMRDHDEAATNHSIETATPDRTGPETAPLTQPSATGDRTEPRTPTPPRWSPVPSTGDGGDGDDDDDEDNDDDD